MVELRLHHGRFDRHPELLEAIPHLGEPRQIRGGHRVPHEFPCHATSRFVHSSAPHPEVGEPYLRAPAQTIARLRTDRELSTAVIGKYTKTEDRS
jgi:hypothetical protein